MSVFEIPASHLRQFIFCPRIPFIVLALGAQPPAPPWTTQGTAWHLDRLRKERRRAFRAYGFDQARLITERPLRHVELGLTGIPDAILETPQALAILECKSTASSVGKGLLMQVYAYQLMAVETFHKPCTAVFLVTHNGRRMRKIRFPENIHEMFLETLTAVRGVLAAGAMPATTATPAKCAQCEYINWCADRA